MDLSVRFRSGSIIIQMRPHKIFGPITRWKIELRPLRDPSIKRQKMRWHALMSGDDINYSTKPTKPNLTSSNTKEFQKNMHQLNCYR